MITGRSLRHGDEVDGARRRDGGVDAVEGEVRRRVDVAHVGEARRVGQLLRARVRAHHVLVQLRQLHAQTNTPRRTVKIMSILSIITIKKICEKINFLLNNHLKMLLDFFKILL